MDISHDDRTLIIPKQPQSPHRPLRTELTSDESFDHVDGSVRLRTRLNYPAVLGTWEDLVVDLAAGRPVRSHEVLLHCGEHVVIQFALQDEHRRQDDVLATLEDMLRIGVKNAVPRIEVELAIGN